MGDWMISKKRFWGLALPIWVDEQTGDFEVIGSREELKERAVEGWDKFEGHTPHRPWIDQVKIRNPKTGNLMSRIPDVGNPWLDAGIVPFSTMGYNTRSRIVGEVVPGRLHHGELPGPVPQLVLRHAGHEHDDGDRPPFKVLLGHALVRDQNGEEMHKTEGQRHPVRGARPDRPGYADPEQSRRGRGTVAKRSAAWVRPT